MITLTLSDDVALDIMAQIGGQVGQKLKQTEVQNTQQQDVLSSTQAVIKIRKFVDDSRVGVMIGSDRSAAIRLGVEDYFLSNTINKMMKEGILERVQKGVYKKVR